MCDPITIALGGLGALGGLFGGSKGDDGAAAQAKADADRALAAQKQAQDQAAAAGDSASEQDRQSQEEAMRKLLAAGGFGATMPSGAMSAPQVGTRQLYGG